MRLAIESIVNDVMFLGGALTVTSSKHLNEILSAIEALAQKELEVGPLIERWYCRRRGKQIDYIYISMKGSSIFMGEAPSGVDISKIPIVDIDPDDRPGFKLLEQMSQFLDQLSSDSQVKIEGSRESFELTCNVLRRVLANVRETTSETYNENIVREASRRLNEAVFLSLGEAKAAKGELEKITGEIAKLRSSLGADGRLASYFLIYRDVCIGIEDFYIAKGNKRLAIREFIRYVVRGSGSNVVCDPMMLIQLIIKALMWDGLYKLAEGLGYQYLKKGEQLVDQALESKSLDGFSSALYTAGLFFFASRQIFEALSEDTTNVVCANELYCFKKAAKDAEEKQVRVCNSFTNAVQNRNGEKLQMHRQLVEDAKRKSAQDAADKIFELIEMNYFYPYYFREILMGNEHGKNVMEYKFNTYSRKVGAWYDWMVFIDEPDDKLDKVESILYEIDPSYPDPIRFIYNRASKFALWDSGPCGRFQIGIIIHLKDGNDIHTVYELDAEKNIKKPWPK